MRRADALLALLLLGLTGCDSSTPGMAPGPSFSQDILPIFNRHCVMCHMADGAQGEFSLHPQPHAALVGVPSSQSELLLVNAGDVEASYLYHKLVGSHLDVGGEGDSMPYQRALLDARDLAAIEQWIAQGAGNH
jgi:mono/diheme cytochrome c family protein